MFLFVFWGIAFAPNNRMENVLNRIQGRSDDCFVPFVNHISGVIFITYDAICLGMKIWIRI